MFHCFAKLITKGDLVSGRPHDTVRQNQVAAMHEATQLGTRLVKERVPQGVGGSQNGLFASIKPDVHPTRAGVIGLISTAYRYGLVVEEGRRPGKKMPPAGSLKRWVKVKMGVSAKEAEQIEFLVRRKIGRDGIEGVHMFRNTLKEDWQDFQNIFDRYGVKIARELEQP